MPCFNISFNNNVTFNDLVSVYLGTFFREQVIPVSINGILFPFIIL